jgi:hypothetical protein
MHVEQGPLGPIAGQNSFDTLIIWEGRAWSISNIISGIIDRLDLG